MDAEQWDERYRSSGRVWSGAPNATIVAAVPAPPHPGALALDLGCGEGADALWLASQGWAVVGVDWSAVALERARAEAASRQLGGRLRFVQGDATDPVALRDLSPVGGFDLVILAFLHPEPEDRAGTYAHLPALLAPGGALVVLTHDPQHAERGYPGPPPHRLLGAPDVLDALGAAEHRDLVVERAETIERRDAEGEVVAVDALVVAVRRSVA